MERVHELLRTIDEKRPTITNVTVKFRIQGKWEDSTSFRKKEKKRSNAKHQESERISSSNCKSGRIIH
jgi:hypothetical protein